jgi:hypothetical protein
MKLLFWKKEEAEQAPGYAPYEEINAKKTSLLGYFFLVLMVVFGVWQGNNFLYALQQTIDRPTPNSNCLSIMSYYDTTKNTVYDTDYYYGYSYTPSTSECAFNEREIRLSIPTLYKSIEPNLRAINASDEKISKIQNGISQAQYSRETYISEYETSLLEDIANTQNPVFNQIVIQTDIMTQDEYIRRLEGALGEEKATRQNLIAAVTRAVAPYAATIERAKQEYRHEMIVYQFIQFIVSLLFIAPLFVYVWRRYHAAKNNRSEYAIIWGGLVATSGLLLAQVLFVFIYEILPREIIQAIFTFLAGFQFLWTLLYWFGFILVPLFFGFLIYLIQKKFYNKQAVHMRAIKNERCPGCSLKLHHDMNNCPICGYALKTRCQTCNAMTMQGGNFCSTCGVRTENSLQ